MHPPANRTVDRLLLGMLLTLVFLLGCYDLFDSDYWWHLRAGQLIWERGAVPRVNEFAYTNPETPWIDLHWLFQLGLYGLHSLGGVGLPILVKSVLGATVIGIAWSTGRAHWPVWQGVALWLPAVFAFTGRFDVRPEILTLLAIASFMWVLVHSEKRPRLLWILPAIQVLWVNVQGLFILGPLILGAFLVDAALRRPKDFPWRLWIIVFPLTLGACFINPYGWEGVTFPLILQERIQGENHAFYKQFAGEFEGYADFFKEAAVSKRGLWGMFTNLSVITQTAVFGLGVATFIALARLGKFSPFRIILFVAFSYLLYQANRNSVLFALVCGLVVYWNQGELSELMPKRDDDASARLQPLVGFLLVMFLIAAPSGWISVARGMGADTQQPRTFGFGVAEWVPFDAVALLAHDGMPKRVYAQHLGMASLYMLRCGPEKQVFVDARLEANSAEALAKSLEYLRRLVRGDADAEEILLQNVPPGPDGVREMPALLFDSTSLIQSPPLLRALADHPHWRCVFLDTWQGGVFLWDDQVARLKISPTIDLHAFIEALDEQRRLINAAN